MSAGGLSARLRPLRAGITDWLASWRLGRRARPCAPEGEGRVQLALDAAGMAIWEMDA